VTPAPEQTKGDILKSEDGNSGSINADATRKSSHGPQSKAKGNEGERRAREELEAQGWTIVGEQVKVIAPNPNGNGTIATVFVDIVPFPRGNQNAYSLMSRTVRQQPEVYCRNSSILR
jgi:hypothetical protein